jgi:hypothetical protein
MMPLISQSEMPSRYGKIWFIAFAHLIFYVSVSINPQIGDNSSSEDLEYSGSTGAQLSPIWKFILTLTYLPLYYSILLSLWMQQATARSLTPLYAPYFLSPYPYSLIPYPSSSNNHPLTSQSRSLILTPKLNPLPHLQHLIPYSLTLLSPLK